MLTRREFVGSLALAGAGMGTGLLAGCGQQPSLAAVGPATIGSGGRATSVVPRGAVDPATVPGAAAAVRAFSADLYRHLSRSEGNLICSPYSVAVALAMCRNGARGTTGSEMDRVLHSPGPEQFNGGLRSLEALLAQHSGRVRRADGSPAEVSLRVANSLWGQHDLAWQNAFLDTLARHYGSEMRLVDYRADAQGARVQINTWTSEQTQDKIKELLPPDIIDAMTRLVLVNAVHLKAPWESPFEPARTKMRRFRRADGSTADVPTMASVLGNTGYARGTGWQAAELRYAGKNLAMVIVVPDHGAFQTIERNLDIDRITQIKESLSPVQSLDLRLPKWTFRTQANLDKILPAMGMPAAFGRTADFSGMTTQERLRIDSVQHEAFIAVDEAGTEAAAATAVVAMAVAAPPPPVPLVVDRPFLFVIHDPTTATPLFIGRVMDPTD